MGYNRIILRRDWCQQVGLLPPYGINSQANKYMCSGFSVFLKILIFMVSLCLFSLYLMYLMIIEMMPVEVSLVVKTSGSQVCHP